MKLVPRDPFFSYFPQFKDLNRLFNIELGDEDSTIATSNWAPAVDIAENDSHFLIEADVPGVKPEDIGTADLLPAWMILLASPNMAFSAYWKPSFAHIFSPRMIWPTRFLFQPTSALEKRSFSKNVLVR